MSTYSIVGSHPLWLDVHYGKGRLKDQPILFCHSGHALRSHPLPLWMSFYSVVLAHFGRTSNGKGCLKSTPTFAGHPLAKGRSLPLLFAILDVHVMVWPHFGRSTFTLPQGHAWVVVDVHGKSCTNVTPTFVGHPNKATPRIPHPLIITLDVPLVSRLKATPMVIPGKDRLKISPLDVKVKVTPTLVV